MEQFTLEKYLQDPTRKVITRDGRNVRIICTDAKNSSLPIVALINDGHMESLAQYYNNGVFPSDSEEKYDLFFAPTKRSRWVYLYNGICDGDKIELTSISYSDKEEAEKNMERDNGFGLTEITWEE